jgi:hypothetical protein
MELHALTCSLAIEMEGAPRPLHAITVLFVFFKILDALLLPFFAPAGGPVRHNKHGLGVATRGAS